MTLPTGQISFGDLNNELGRPTTQQISLNDGSVRGLAGQSGQIDMNALRGKSNATFTVTNQRGSTSASTTVSCNISVTWTWNCYDRHGGTSYAPTATSGSQTSTSFGCGITTRQTGSIVANAGQTVDVTATYPGGSRSWEFQFGLGTQ